MMNYLGRERDGWWGRRSRRGRKTKRRRDGREVEREEEDVEISYNKTTTRERKGREGGPGRRARDCGFRVKQ